MPMDVDAGATPMEGLEGPPGKASGKFDALLSTPPEALDGDVAQETRAQAAYENRDARFMLPEKKYGQQFAQIYYSRLMAMSPLLRTTIAAKWPGVPASKILNVEEDKECVVIGTVYKEMKLKPSILDEYTAELTIKPSVSLSKFTSEEDHIVMEDEGARMKLSGGCLAAADLATGVVVAVRGRDVGDEFQVEDICYPAPAQQAPPPVLDDDKYVCLVSGLGAAPGGGAASPLAVQMLVDFLTGMLGGGEDAGLSARVVRTVVCGDTLGGATGDQLMAPAAGDKRQDQLVSPVKEVDMLLTELAAAMPVDIMPGAADPTNYSLPQQPLHRCLLPSTTAFSTLVRATNPHEFDIAGGVRFLGTSGQNVNDLFKYTSELDRAALLARTLAWRHVAPTAPDTLACYPFHDQDPFVVEELPHVYFAGNQPAFSSIIVPAGGAAGGAAGAGGETRVVCVPRFAETGTAVLVNLRTRECHPVTFAAGGAAAKAP